MFLTTGQHIILPTQHESISVQNLLRNYALLQLLQTLILLDTSSNPRIAAMFLATGRHIIVPTQPENMYRVKLPLKFLMVGCSDSLVITVKSKPKENIHTTVTMLLLIFYRQEVGR
jgi:cellulose biosynthesis protein BcsQ